MALSAHDLRELRDALIDGIREGFENANTSGGGGTSGTGGTSGGGFIHDEERRNREIERILRENDAIRSGAHANTALGRDRIRENDERVERLRNGGISEKDVKKYREKKGKEKIGKAKEIIGQIKQIGDAVITIYFAYQRNSLAMQKNHFEQSQKILKADIEYRGKQMKNLTTTFNAFTSSIATDAAFASSKAANDVAMGQFGKSVTGISAATEFSAAEKKREATLNKTVGNAIGNGMMAVGGIIMAAAGWTGVGLLVGGVVAAIGGLVSLFTSASAEQKELDAETLEQSNEQFKQQMEMLQNLYGHVGDVVGAIDDNANRIVEYTLKNDETYKQMGMTTGFTGERYAAYGRKMSEALSKTFNITAQQAKQMFDSYSTESGRTMLLNERDYGNIKSVGRGFGISEGESAKLLGHMNLFNQSIGSGASMLTKEWKQITKMGLSSTKYAKDLDKNLKLAEKHNFKGGIQGMMKLSKWAQQTRFNIDNAVSFAEKLQEGNLSDNIETSAKLQVLGGAAARYSDPLGMMFDAWNDVGSLAERQAKMFSDISGTFNAKTGQTEFTGYENMMIAARAKAAGLDVADVKNMLREQDKQKQVGKVLNDYNNLSEEAKTAIGNRAKWNQDKGTWEVETMNGTMSLADVAALKDAQREEILMPENEEETLYDINKDTRAIREIMEGTRNAAMGRAEKETYKDVKNFAESTTASQMKLLNSQLFIDQARESMQALARQAEVNVTEVMDFMSKSKDLIATYRQATLLQIKNSYKVDEKTRTAVQMMASKGADTEVAQALNQMDYLYNSSADTKDINAYYNSLNAMERQAVSGFYKKEHGRWVTTTQDGVGNANGGVMFGASNIRPINDGAVNVGFAKNDQYLAAKPNGPIDKILQQLIPGLQALLRGNGSSNGSLNLNVNGRIDLEDSGSTVNIVELIKNNPKIASQLVSIIKRTMEVNSAGKPIRSYM